MTYHLLTADAPALCEDPHTQIRRRIQQKRCLVCGARGLVNHGLSYFCRAHITTHRYCSTCETLRAAADHGKDSRCRSCANERAIRAYYADPDRMRYRVRLMQLARRTQSTGDLIFASMRKRIALAAIVASTPGWTWQRRAAAFGMQRNHMADSYRKQCAGLVRDADASDQGRRHP